MFHLCLKISKPDDHSWFMKDFGYQVHSVLTLTLFGKGCIQYIFVIYKQKTTNFDEGYIYSNYSRVFNIFIDHLKKGWYICTWWFSILSGFFFFSFWENKIPLLYFSNSSTSAIIKIYGITVNSTKCFVNRYPIWFLK